MGQSLSQRVAPTPHLGTEHDDCARGGDGLVGGGARREHGVFRRSLVTGRHIRSLTPPQSYEPPPPGWY